MPHFDKEFKFRHQEDWTPTDQNWLPNQLASCAFVGDHAKRIRYDGVVPEEAKEAVRIGCATFVERERLKYERENEELRAKREREQQNINNKRQRLEQLE